MKMNYNEFAEKVKLKDDRFKDMDNISVAKQVIKENPYYADKVDFEETKRDVALGAGRSIGQIATFGQAPHLAGIYDAYGGAIYNALHGKNPFKDVKDDYIKGREDYKKEQGKFAKLHPGLNFTGEAIGTLATLPVGGAVGKIPTVAKFLKGAGAVKKGALAGAGWGGALAGGESLSNTEGKGFDLQKAAISLPIGAAIGGTIGGAIPLAFNGIKGGIKALVNLPNKLKTGSKGDVVAYTVPEGTSTKSQRKLIKNPEIQKAAEDGNIGMNVEKYQNKAAEETLAFVPERFDKISKDYENIPKDTFISLDKTNTVGKMLQAVKDFSFNTKFMPKPQIEEEVNNFVQKISKAGKTVNNEYGITYENLKRGIQTAYELEQKAYKEGDNAVGALYHNIRQALKEARATNKNIENITQKYSAFSKAKELLEKSLGIKFEKGANHRQVATKLIQQGRVRAGTQLDDTLTQIDDILSPYKDLKGAKQLQTSIDTAQVSYDYRPPEESKLLNRMPTQKTLTNKLFAAVFQNSPQELAKKLARNLKAGRITQAEALGEFDIINAGKFTTPLNRFLQRQKIYGGKFNPIAALMRRKSQSVNLPTFLLTDGKRFSDIIRNPLILETNKRRELLKNIIRSNKNGNTKH